MNLCVAGHPKAVFEHIVGRRHGTILAKHIVRITGERFSIRECVHDVSLLKKLWGSG
jgi:hypothetical protein